MDTIKLLQDLRAAMRAKADQATITADDAPNADEHHFSRGISVGFRVAANDIDAAISKLLDRLRAAA